MLNRMFGQNPAPTASDDRNGESHSLRSSSESGAPSFSLGYRHTTALWAPAAPWSPVMMSGDLPASLSSYSQTYPLLSPPTVTPFFPPFSYASTTATMQCDEQELAYLQTYSDAGHPTSLIDINSTTKIATGGIFSSAPASDQPSSIFHRGVFQLPSMPPPPLVHPPARILVHTWEHLQPPSHVRMYDSEQEWLTDARNKRAAYAHTYALPALRWVLVEEGERIPSDALQTGTEATGEPLYSIRSWHNGGLHLGKGGHHIFKGHSASPNQSPPCSINLLNTDLLALGGSVSWGSQEYVCATFEILVGDTSLAKWVSVPSTPSNALSENLTDPSSFGSLSPLALTPLASPTALPTLEAPKCIHSPSTAPSDITAFTSVYPSPIEIRPFAAIEGGFEPKANSAAPASHFGPFSLAALSPWSTSQSKPVSSLLFIAQAYYADGWHPGKVEAGDDHCCIGWGGGEVWVKNFRVLAWAI